MSDATLLVFGCGVSFIAFSAVYVYLRAGSEADETPIQLERPPVKTASSKTA